MSQDSSNPIAEDKARTLEAIVKMLPGELTGSESEDFEDAYNTYRSEVISLLPQIIEEIESRKVEGIRKMIEDYKNSAPKESAFFDGIDIATKSILSKL